MPVYYRNCHQYSENNQKQPSLETVNQRIETIKKYLSNKAPYLVTSDDTLDNSESLKKLQDKENSFKEIHEACIILIDMINGSYDVDDNSQNEMRDYWVANFSSIEEAKNQLLSLAGEIEQNLYLIQQAQFIEKNQLDLEEVERNNDAKCMAEKNNMIVFWDELSDPESRKEILARNHNSILTFTHVADETARTSTGNIKAISALWGNKQVSNNYAPYLLRRVKYEVPKPDQPMNFIYHGTLETVKETLLAYFNAIEVARNIALVSMANDQEITFQDLSYFLSGEEHQNFIARLKGTELCKSDGFAPSLYDGDDNSVAISLFEAKQAKMMNIYACLQVLIEALDDAVRTGIGENDIRAIFDSRFCGLVGCDFAELRHTLFLMLRKIGYTLYHIEQAIFFERMQAAVITKNRDVESAKEYHAPVHFLNLADTADTDKKMANAITAYNHQVIQNYLDFFTRKMQGEHKKFFKSLLSKQQDNQSTVRNDDNFFLAALNSLNNIESAGEFSCQYEIEYGAKEYDKDFIQFAELILAYPKPRRFTILQEPHYAEPKLQPAILNLPEEPQAENSVPSMPFNTLRASSYSINTSDAVLSIKKYEQAKEASQQYLSTLTAGDTSKTVNEHRLTQEPLCESLYPIIKYHVISRNCFGNKGTLETIGEKITLLTSVQHAYHRFLLILSDMKQNLEKNNADLTTDFRQAFPELIETLGSASTGSNEDKCREMLIVLEEAERELVHKLHLIEGRLYIAMQAQYVEQIEASVNATGGITDENGAPIITLVSSKAADIHKAAQRQPLKFSPVDDRGLDSIIEENNKSITQHYNAIKKGFEACKSPMQREFRQKRAQYGLTRVLMLREEDLSIPVDQNTIYLQHKEGFLTAYWIKKDHVAYQSFPQTEMPDIINSLLPLTGESSDNKELIEAIRVKFKCMQYGSSHPENNPSLFITIDKASAKSLPIPQNNSSMTADAYQACIDNIPSYKESTLSALKQTKTYAHNIRDFLRGILALQPKDDSDEKTFLAIFHLFKLLTGYLSYLNNPKKFPEKPSEMKQLLEIFDHIDTLKNICVHNDSKSQVAMMAYSQFLSVFNQMIDGLDKKKPNTADNKDNNIKSQMTRALSMGITLFAQSETQENNENSKLQELFQTLKDNPFPSMSSSHSSLPKV